MSPARKRQSPSHRVRGPGLRALLVGALVAGGMVASTTPAGAAIGTVTATPDSDLVDGQTISVHGTGWEPFASIGFCQGVPLSPPDPTVCSGGTYHSTSANAAGAFTVPLVVKRNVFIPRLGRQVDCANPAENCVVGAANINDGIPVDAAYATIDFVGAPVIKPGAASVLEGNTATTSLAVPVTLTFASTDTVTAQWTTALAPLPPGAPAGQADPATDFTPASGEVMFAPGDTEETVTISVNGDPIDESNEWIVVSFANPTNATMGGFYGLGFGGITNDDPTTVVPGAASVAEGNVGPVDLVVPVTLSNPSSKTIAVEYTTKFTAGAPAGQADPATDFTPVSGTVTFAPGETSKTVTISVNGDVLVEPNEYVLVSFHHPTNAKMGGYYGLGFGRIDNDD